MKLSLFCPSRGRPDEARALKHSFDSTILTTDAELVFLIDKDDPLRESYPDSFIFGDPTGDPTGPLNREALRSRSEIVGFIGDDSRFETDGWDEKVLAALETPGFCWTMDGTNNAPWPSTCFVSRAIPDALGWFVLPGLRRGFFDSVWVVLARLTASAHLLPEVMVRHDNSAGDPRSPNFLPERRVPAEVIAQDEAVFRRWQDQQAKADAQRIRRVLYQ